MSLWTSSALKGIFHWFSVWHQQIKSQSFTGAENRQTDRTSCTTDRKQQRRSSCWRKSLFLFHHSENKQVLNSSTVFVFWWWLNTFPLFTADPMLTAFIQVFQVLFGKPGRPVHIWVLIITFMFSVQRWWLCSPEYSWPPVEILLIKTDTKPNEISVLNPAL